MSIKTGRKVYMEESGSTKNYKGVTWTANVNIMFLIVLSSQKNKITANHCN